MVVEVAVSLWEDRVHVIIVDTHLCNYTHLTLRVDSSHRSKEQGVPDKRRDEGGSYYVYDPPKESRSKDARDAKDIRDRSSRDVGREYRPQGSGRSQWMDQRGESSQQHHYRTAEDSSRDETSYGSMSPTSNFQSRNEQSSRIVRDEHHPAHRSVRQVHQPYRETHADVQLRHNEERSAARDQQLLAGQSFDDGPPPPRRVAFDEEQFGRDDWRGSVGRGRRSVGPPTLSRGYHHLPRK